MQKNDFWSFRLILQVLILLALGTNIWLIATLDSKPDEAKAFEELEITFITAQDCETCFSLDAFRDYFTENGVTEDQFKNHDYQSFTGKRLVKKYEIEQLPTLIIEGSVDQVDYMQGLIDSVGVFREDAFVVTSLQPPYLDLVEDRIVGEFNVTYLTDATCLECYDVSLHDFVFERMALQPSQKETVDVNSEEGKELVERYGVTAVPTILLAGELDSYDSLNRIWAENGSIDPDGTYVLRVEGVEDMGAYKDLSTGEVIVPEPEEDEGQE